MLEYTSQVCQKVFYPLGRKVPLSFAKLNLQQFAWASLSTTSLNKETGNLYFDVILRDVKKGL